MDSMPPGHGHTAAAPAASNKLGTLLATDSETVSVSGHATIHLTMLRAVTKLLKHPRRLRLTLVLTLRDVRRHEFESITHVTLHG